MLYHHICKQTQNSSFKKLKYKYRKKKKKNKCIIDFREHIQWFIFKDMCTTMLITNKDKCITKSLPNWKKPAFNPYYKEKNKYNINPPRTTNKTKGQIDKRNLHFFTLNITLNAHKTCEKLLCMLGEPQMNTYFLLSRMKDGFR